MARSKKIARGGRDREQGHDLIGVGEQGLEQRLRAAAPKPPDRRECKHRPDVRVPPDADFEPGSRGKCHVPDDVARV